MWPEVQAMKTSCKASSSAENAGVDMEADRCVVGWRGTIQGFLAEGGTPTHYISLIPGVDLFNHQALAPHADIWMSSPVRPPPLPPPPPPLNLPQAPLPAPGPSGAALSKS